MKCFYLFERHCTCLRALNVVAGAFATMVSMAAPSLTAFAMRALILISGVFSLCAPSVANAAVINNGSFETGDFTGWGVSDLSIPYFPLQVTTDGQSSFGFSSTATNGFYSAVHGFDGSGPGVIRLIQDVGTIDTLSNLLTFDYRAAWDMTYGATLSRTFTVSIYDSNTLNILASHELLKSDAGTTNYDTGNILGAIDLRSFQGQSVGISFDFYIPEVFTGPAFFQLDNIQLTPVPEPTSMAIFGLGALGIVYRARRKNRS
ncbi:MAG: hypothetical protein RL069_2286 [Planctomycetota bacterium]|jgi:hypothetical protein